MAKKLTELTEASTVNDGDFFDISQYQGGVNYTSKKLNFASLATSLYSQLLSKGVVPMVNGVDKLTVSGLGLAYTPSVVICTVSKPSSDDLNIIATVQLNSISADGFTVHFSADPDSSGYKLNYVVFQ